MIKPVVHEVGDDLRRQVWRYYLDDHKMQLRLDQYLFQERPTKRHNWRTVTKWTWMQSRGEITREEVPTPDDVKVEALRKFREMITIE